MVLLEGGLALLVLVNLATGRLALAGVVLAACVVAWVGSRCCGDGGGGRRGPTMVTTVDRGMQRKLARRVRDASPLLPARRERVVIDRPGNPNIEATFLSPRADADAGADADDEDDTTAAATVAAAVARRTRAKVCFVCTHPWSVMGGDRSNNVPTEVTEALASYGFSALRFDFRGVGGSSGCCTCRGHGERNDVKAVCEWLVAERGIAHIVLVGYSYGSMISNSCAEMVPEIRSVVSIATPFPCYWGLSLFNCRFLLRKAREGTKPILFICGDEDNFTSPAQYRRYVSSFPRRGVDDDGKEGGNESGKEVFLIRGVDHFWFGEELTAVALILRFVRKHHPNLFRAP